MSVHFDLPAFGPGGGVHVVIEATQGTHAKHKYDRTMGVFLFSRALPHGLVYPFDWGFIPSTCGQDGDPLDAMVLHETACPVGAVVRCRPVAVLEVDQTEKGSTLRNDRFLMAPTGAGAADEADLSARLKNDLEQFFAAAVLGTGKTLKFRGWRNGARALAQIREAVIEQPGPWVDARGAAQPRRRREP